MKKIVRTLLPTNKKFIQDEPIIMRDFLALERTRLANERTLMAYVRTALYLLLGGIAFLQMQDFEHIRWFGLVIIILSFLMALFGVIRFFVIKNRLHQYYK
ncbi:MAG TPA: DUF202 domain-containing protein [Bacteroidales bacterium]|jgi:putative membrane protein|nr:DUF202 domain-containing protein [Bacteroidales bacterium]MDY0084596.1 DUF202 domain-containing protein [Bacteroidales bacterium]HPE43616.1 DUF202 domain-containing protein [Bacteroidales bacterium]